MGTKLTLQARTTNQRVYHQARVQAGGRHILTPLTRHPVHAMESKGRHHVSFMCQRCQHRERTKNCVVLRVVCTHNCAAMATCAQSVCALVHMPRAACNGTCAPAHARRGYRSCPGSAHMCLERERALERMPMAACTPWPRALLCALHRKYCTSILSTWSQL